MDAVASQERFGQLPVEKLGIGIDRQQNDPVFPVLFGNGKVIGGDDPFGFGGVLLQDVEHIAGGGGRKIFRLLD